MKLIKPKAELLIQPNGLEGIYKQVELAGRTCYKSTDKITEDSAKPFVDRMINSNHLAMLEHGTVYLAIPCNDEETLSHYRGVAGKYNEVEFTRYSKVTMMRGTHNYVTSNYRVLAENNWLDDLQYICEPTEFHEKRYTFRCITDRGVSHEMVRHRVFSFAQESTRYCNYSKDKFGNEITFIIPSWARTLHEGVLEYSVLEITPKEATFMESCYRAEKNYFEMINESATPQEARQVLPNALKTEICMTGFASDWKHFFDLRYYGKTGKPHPDMLQLATLMKEEADKHGIWKEISNSNK